jgi:hypothetical protein
MNYEKAIFSQLMDFVPPYSEMFVVVHCLTV